MPNFLAAVRCKLISACITFSRYLATASADHTVKIWNVDGFTLEKTLIGIHQVTTFYCACCFLYMSKIDPVVTIEPMVILILLLHVLSRTSTLGMGLCVLSRWRLSYNRYLY